MPKLKDLVRALSDEELCDAILEISEWHKKAYLKLDGIIRRIGDQAEVGHGNVSDLIMVEREILYAAALKYIQSRSKDQDTLKPSDYECCPHCKGSFSFRKPKDDFLCPYCRKDIRGT